MENNNQIKIARLEQCMLDLKEDLQEVKESIKALSAEIKERDKRFITEHQFYPVKLIAYGLVGAICLSVLGAILALIFK